MKLLQKKQQLPNRRSASLSKEGRASAEDLNARYAFKRNRTLTGSLSSDVASANEHRAELRSDRVQAHHLRKHRRRLLAALAGVLAVIAGISWLLYQSIAGVNIVVRASSPPLNTSAYQAKVQEYLNGRPLERNRMMINLGSLAKYLQNNGFPEVAGASVDSSPTALGVSTIVLTMRQPVVSWKTGATQLYVDSNGAAFKNNYYNTPAVDVVDQTGIQTVDNQVLASDRFLGFIGKIIGRLSSDQGLTATKVVLPANTTRQLLVSVQGVSYPIKFTVDRPAGEQAEDAARAIRYLAGKGVQPQYLDVRVQGRAYYK